MPSLLKFMGGVAAACLLAGFGCAFTTETIHIDYPAPVSVEKIKGAEVIKVKVEIRDLRSNPDPGSSQEDQRIRFGNGLHLQ